MEGFWDVPSVKKSKHNNTIFYTCVACGGSKTSETPKMKGTGLFKKKILILTEIPSRIDDKKGKLLQDIAGKRFSTLLAKKGVDIQRDCFTLSAIRCYSKEPKGIAVECCRKSILKIIEEKKPKLIIVLGMTGVLSLIANRFQRSMGDIDKWRGWNIPDQDFKAWICPTYSLEYALSSDTLPEVATIFRKDITKALSLIKKNLPIQSTPEIIDISMNMEELDRIDSKYIDTVAIDYETTGIKPHRKGHRIVCGAVAVTVDNAFVFDTPEVKYDRTPLLRLLQDEGVGKVAHNLKFEDAWSKVRLRTGVNGWLFDTMIAAHVLDNRRGVTSLKFQTYVQLGVVDYESEVSKYLKSEDSTDANSKNQLIEAYKNPVIKEAVKKYCALDTIYTLRLYYIFIEQLKALKLEKAYELLHKGVEALGRVEQTGLRVNEKYIEKRLKRLDKKVLRLETEFKETKFYRHWKHALGRADMYSGDQLGTYLYKIKKLKPVKTTKTGKGSTDEEALRFLDIPELHNLVKIKQCKKQQDYLQAFTREQVNGVLRPFYNLHLVTTYRSSSNSPNFQNIPKRDAQSKKLIRGALFARPGNHMLSVDFSGVEVSIAATYHKDPTMLKYLAGDGDLHGDMAKQIFVANDFQRDLPTHKLLRNAAKNGFVFPQFYGDYYRNNAVSLCQWVELPESKWKEGMGVDFSPGKSISTHLMENGIKSFEVFANHLKKIEKDFWGRRFPKYTQWKVDLYKEYQKKGSLSSKTGFIFQGEMKKNKLLNYPIQGSAFHCLLWTLIETDRLILKKKLKTRIIGQIHDDIVLDVPPEELKRVGKLIKSIATKRLRKTWEWIDTPLGVEAEVTPPGGSYATMAPYEL